MYRILYTSGKIYATEMLTSGRSAEDELHEMKIWVEDGYRVEIASDYKDLEAELITRDYL